MEEQTNKQTLQENELNELGAENDDSYAPEEQGIPQLKQDVFNPGEQSVAITFNNINIQTHFTNSTPEQTSNFALQLLEQSQNILTKSKGGLPNESNPKSYLG